MEKEKNIWLVFLVAIVAVVGVVGIVSIAKMAQTTTSDGTTEGLVGQAAKRCTTQWMDSPYCQNGKDVWQKWRNADCSITPKKKSTCAETCTAGVCRCTERWMNTPRCWTGSVWDTWKKADCSTVGKVKENCKNGCANNACKAGCTPAWLNKQYCKKVGTQTNVWDKYKNSDCTTTDKQREVCTTGCSAGTCNAGPTCVEGWIGLQYCKTGDTTNLWDSYRNRDCTETVKVKEVCKFGCANNACTPAPCTAGLISYGCEVASKFQTALYRRDDCSTYSDYTGTWCNNLCSANVCTCFPEKTYVTPCSNRQQQETWVRTDCTTYIKTTSC